LLFAPSARPFDLFDPDARAASSSTCAGSTSPTTPNLLPPYLRFVRRRSSTSEDLPLNISREMLQNNPQVAQIRNAVTGRVISELESLAAKDATTFNKRLGGVRQRDQRASTRIASAATSCLLLPASPRPKMPACVPLKEYVADLSRTDGHLHLVGESMIASSRARSSGGPLPRSRVLLLTVMSMRSSRCHWGSRQTSQVASQGDVARPRARADQEAAAGDRAERGG